MQFDPIDHIVVATDLTEAARYSYPHAAAWSRIYNARVTVLHVSPSPSELGHDAESSIDTTRLRTIAADLGELGVTDIATEIRHGDIAESVAAFVEETGADMVICAKHSNLLERVLKLGSTTNRILRLAKVPTLVVHDEDTPISPARIAVAVDATERSNELVDMVMKMAPRLEAVVTLVHAHEKTLTAQQVTASPMGTTETPEEAFHSALRELVSNYQYQGLSARVWTGDKKSAGALIAEMAAQTDANLIAIASSGKGLIGRMLLGSTTTQVCAKATVPVLVFPAEWLHMQEPDANA